ncbi:MAG: AAA family ATPase [Dysgonomonas sp.]|nr:AAA family ATPase [Dysgonomonas sp.]
MKITKIIIEDFKGIRDKTTIIANDFNCIVGKNDIGKSTILQALDIFLNDKSPSSEDKNINANSDNITIELFFEIGDIQITIDDAILTTFKDEELLDENGFLVIKKVWNVSKKTPKTEWYIRRKIYSDDTDFLFLKEPALIKLCNNLNIPTSKGNNEEYNNVEKRRKLRDLYQANQYAFSFGYTQLQTTGQTREKNIVDILKNLLPSFEYFRADSSLSESDSSIQRYFRDKALGALKNEIDTNDLEETIRDQIGKSLQKITALINSVVTDEEQITASVEFDWSRLITTSFKSSTDNANIPLSSRGDGFRRITMMSYFEMLAEEKNQENNVIYGFEEPETFLHPETQKLLFDKLINLSKADYQIFTTTHSPIIVSRADTNSIIFINRVDNIYKVIQHQDINIETIVDELGIKPNDELIKIYDNIKALLLVEGKDDVIAFSHVARIYKQQNLIEKDFIESGIHILPIGGCGSIQNWTNLNIITNLNKPFYIVLDSDKTSERSISKTRITLTNIGYRENQDFQLTRKREIENYIPDVYFHSLDAPIDISYGDWDDVKTICILHEEGMRLGGKYVLKKHFPSLDYNHLKTTFCPDGNLRNDEFLDIYHKLLGKIGV